jgi:hypothetical protein
MAELKMLISTVSIFLGNLKKVKNAVGFESY